MIIILLILLIITYMLYKNREGIRVSGRKKKKTIRRKKKNRRRKKKKTIRKKKKTIRKKISVCKGKCCEYNNKSNYNTCRKLDKLCGQKILDGCLNCCDIDCFEERAKLKC